MLVDEVGFDQLSMGVVAERLGVKTPSLYKHVDSLADLGHRIAVLAAVELADAIRDATQGRADLGALTAAAQALRIYARDHPGRYAALNSSRLAGYDDPFVLVRGRLLDSFAAVLRGYRVHPSQQIHALRMLRSMLHGFVTLEVAGGFQIDTDTDDSFDWIVSFVDRGLRLVASTHPSSATPTHDRSRSRR